jgi:hypothetical protein
VLRRASIAVAALFVLLPGPAPRAAECSLSVGQYVLLKSNRLDPDVFVWDTRVRLVGYAAGEWKNTQDVLAHTILAKPGTRAIIIGCEPEVIHFRYEQPVQDAVGLKLVSGPQRGRYGWVASDDAQPIATTVYPTPAPSPRRAAAK